jgi:hypothetical protein
VLSGLLASAFGWRLRRALLAVGPLVAAVASTATFTVSKLIGDTNFSTTAETLVGRFDNISYMSATVTSAAQTLRGSKGVS